MIRDRILVVDDYPDTVDTMCMYFALLGHETRGAADGATAIEAARELDPTIVFLEPSLKTMDGFETARRLRRVRTTPYLVALTGCHAKRASVLDAGFDDYVLKPLRTPLLREILARAHQRYATAP